LEARAHEEVMILHAPDALQEKIERPIPKPSPGRRAAEWIKQLKERRWVRITALATGATVCACCVMFLGLYGYYARVIDQRMHGGPFADSVNIYAAPLTLTVGDEANVADLGTQLRTAGYRESQTGGELSYKVLRGSALEIVQAGNVDRRARVFVTNGRITRIENNGKEQSELDAAAPLITTLSPKKEERLLVRFDAIPEVLVHAILSAEDKHFFHHEGVDFPRLAKAAFVDMKQGRKEQGASTLTMQLVRGLWLDRGKQWKRKLAEVMMTIHLEREWSKEKIFETYVNQVYLGRQADYSMHGFGEGARLFFGKELKDLTLPEAALLAGLVQRPSYFNPFRYPERAKERRDTVLAMMRNNEYITAGQFESAVNEPVRVTGDALSEARAPYFLDLVNDEIQKSQPDDESDRNVYSTIDLNLQRAADEAVQAGMQNVDRLLSRRTDKPGPQAEVALIALDPRTGEIKALVGGRNYQHSQLNRILAKRPPGSVFKPFVYAAALDSAISGGSAVYTPASTVDDSPTTFRASGKPYEPANFRGEHFGVMTFRQALAKSDNVAAVKVAQEVGYGKVVEMARRFGLNDEIRATPAVALGAYQVTPLEIAAAYTAFANGGVRARPVVISGAGRGTESVRTLDPRVNWLMVSMLEEVMRSGTAASVRSLGFTAPAAGKTGTSHDGWFAGFTTQLLCVVWVGFDDYRELGLEGARSALPIWTEFMKRASRMGAYRNTKEFPQPGGIVAANICLDSGKLAGDQCPHTRGEFFVSGSEPTEKCDMHQVEDAPGLEPDEGQAPITVISDPAPAQ
jgi:penicillin-binding protein 1B